MGSGLTIWPTLNGTPVGNGPITGVLSATIILTELGQMSKSNITLAASADRALLALPPFTLLEVEQDEVGTIFYGYVLNPRQQVADNDTHTITIELEPLTYETRQRRVHRGWQAQNTLSVIASRLGSATAGWTGTFDGAGTAADITVLVTSTDSTPLGVFLATAKQFSQYARLGVDVNGAPARVLEMGQFGAAPTMWLVSANAATAAEIEDTSLVRLVATVEREPNSVDNLVNVCTPFGGGSSSDSVVTLERLWRIINDSNYPNYGRYGAVSGSVFPEYDPAYPISDPDQGPGSRYATLDGHWDYMVYDAASFALYGHHAGEFIDSSLTYTDPSPANQEQTARALYMETIANFKHFSKPHHTFTATAHAGGHATGGRVTRAGDLIATDYQRISVNEGGAVVEMDVTENLRVMSVTRTFNGDAPPMDSYILSNLGRFDETDAAGQAVTATNLVALQINKGTGLAKDSVVVAGNLDALNPLTVWHYIAGSHFRYQQVRVRCDFYPYRATASTAQNDPNQTFLITIPTTSVEIENPTAINLSGAFNAAGTGVTGTTDGFDLIQRGTENDAVVRLPVTHDSSTQIGASPGNNLRIYQDGSSGYTLKAGSVSDSTNGVPVNMTINFSKAKTQSAFTAPVNKTVAAAKTLIGKIRGTSIIAPLPQHTHPLDQRIPSGPSPVAIRFDINGQSLSSGASTSGSRNGDGSFSSSFICNDIGVYLDAFSPGTDVPLTFNAYTNESNPYGVGFIQVTITSVEELGGLTSTVRAT